MTALAAALVPTHVLRGTWDALQIVMKPLPVVAVLVTIIACSAGSRVAPIDAGTDLCSSATIRFHFDVPAAKPWCAGAGTSCSNEWLMIRRASGEDIGIDRPCAPDCSSCEPVACPTLCAAPTRIPSEGIDRTWDGRFFASHACANDLRCVDPFCAEPGRYVATMCAYPDRGSDVICSPDKTPSCADVAFDWPPASDEGVVVGRIDQAR